MSWAIAVSNRARKSLKRVPAADQARIMAALKRHAKRSALRRCGETRKSRRLSQTRRELPDHLSDRLKGPGDWHHRYSAPNNDDVPVVLPHPYPSPSPTSLSQSSSLSTQATRPLGKT